MGQREVPPDGHRVDRLNEPELPAVGAAEAEHHMIRQPGLQPEPGFRHVRRVQITGDGIEPAAGAARTRCGQRQSDLVWLQPLVAVQVIPTMDGPGEAMRIAEAQVVEGQTRGVPRVAAQEPSGDRLEGCATSR